MKNKNPTIDIVKGLAIILVVYGHVIEHGMVVQGGDYYLNPLFKIIYTFHMPLFVFISGYLMAFSLSKRSLAGNFKHKCDSLLVPFIFLGSIGIAVSYALNILFGNSVGAPNFSQNLLDQLLLKPSVWFLFTLFIMSCLLLYSVNWEKRFGPAVFLVFYFLIGIIPYKDYGCLYYIKWFYLFFLAGYFMNKYNMKITHKAVQAGVFLIALFLFIMLMPYWKTQDYIYINKMALGSTQDVLRLMYRYLMGFLGIGMVFYIGILLTKIRQAAFLGVIGRYSLDIYIIQMLIVEGIYPRIAYKTHSHIDFNSSVGLYVWTGLLVIFFVGLCMLISKLLIRKNHLLSRLLLGGRL